MNLVFDFLKRSRMNMFLRVRIGKDIGNGIIAYYEAERI